MPRSVVAYLNDIVEACDSVAVTLLDVDIAAYSANRTIRSAVEREFTIIGEAVNSISRLDSGVATRISHARKIVGFRNQLIHDYPAIIDDMVGRTDRGFERAANIGEALAPYRSVD